METRIHLLMMLMTMAWWCTRLGLEKWLTLQTIITSSESSLLKIYFFFLVCVFGASMRLQSFQRGAWHPVQLQVYPTGISSTRTNPETKWYNAMHLGPRLQSQCESSFKRLIRPKWRETRVCACQLAHLCGVSKQPPLGYLVNTRISPISRGEFIGHLVLKK